MRSERFRAPILLSVGAVGAQAFTGVAGALLARAGGPAALGTVASALGVVALVSDLCDLGTGTHIARELAAQNISPADAIVQMRRRMRTYAAVAIVGLVGAPLFLRSSIVPISLMATLYLLAFAINLSLGAVLRALGRYAAAAMLSLVDRLTLLIVVALLYSYGRLSVTPFLIAMTAGSLSASIAGSIVLRIPPWTAGQAHPLRSLYRRSIHLGVSGLATDLSVLETPLVTLGAGVVASGYYGAASRLVGPFAFPAGGSAAVIMRQIAPKADRARAAWPALRSQLYIPIVVVAALGIATAFAGSIVPAIFGSQFSGTAVTVFRILSLTTALSVLTQIFYAALIALREERRAALCQWITVPLGLTLTAIGAFVGGAVLAVLGGLIAQLVQAIWMAFIIRYAIRRGTITTVRPDPRTESDSRTFREV